VLRAESKLFANFDSVYFQQLRTNKYNEKIECSLNVFLTCFLGLYFVFEFHNSIHEFEQEF
jgi:hypothetical protein